MTWSDPRWLVVALAALALLPVAAVMGRWRRLQQARVAAAGLWRRWLGGVPATGAGRVGLWLVAAALAAGAASGPRWGAPGAAAAPSLDLVIALDVSASMGATDVAPDRLARAVVVLRQVLARQTFGNVGLAVGAGTSQGLVPLTPDRATVEARLVDPDLDRWVAPGSNLAGLLATANSLLSDSASARAILLVSDGEELEGNAAQMSAALRRSGVALLSLAVGSVEGAPVPRRDQRGAITYLRDADGALVHSRAHPELLQRLAGADGSAVDASSPSAARQLKEALAGVARASLREEAPVHPAPFALAAALLATASFLLWPWRRPSLAVVLLPFPLLAAAPAPLPAPAAWQRVVPGLATLATRRAAAAAAAGAWERARQEYGRASALDPARRELRLGWAVAATLAGDPKAENTVLELASDPALASMALYDLGTVRLLHGDAAGAVEPLRRALAASPENAEAWRNLEIALSRVDQSRLPRPAADPLAAARRDHLIAAAADAAVQPLIVRAALTEPAGRGRDW